MTVYEQRTHRGGPQTFDITQGRDGILYFGNLAGVVTYDGAWWRLIKLPHDSSADAMVTDARGRVVLGSVGELGYLDDGRAGETTYHSLMPLLPEPLRDFGDLRNICRAGDATLFVTDKFLFSWTEGAPRKVLEFDTTGKTPRNCMEALGKIWLTAETGLQTVDLASGRLLPGPASLNGKDIALVVPVNGQEAIVAVHEAGLLKMDASGAVVPFAPTLDSWFAGEIITGSARLADGRIAFTTRERGVAIVHPSGDVAEIIDNSAGLPDDLLAEPFADREGSLWLAFYGPLARIDLASPVSLVDRRNQMRGSPGVVGWLGGKLHVGTGHGLYVLESTPGSSGSRTLARRLPSIPYSATSIFNVEEGLLVGSGEGLFLLDENEKATLIDGTRDIVVYAMDRSSTDPDRIWLGTHRGVSVLRHRDGRWVYEGMVEGSRPYVTTILESGNGLWCGTVYDGAVRIEPLNGAARKVTSLNPNEETGVFEIGGRVVFIRPTSSIWSVDARGTLIPDPQLGAIKAPNGFFYMAEDQRGNVWINSTPPRLFRKGSDGRFTGEGEPLVQVDAADIQYLKVDGEGTVWFGADRGLYRYEPAERSAANEQPTPLIRRMISGQDRLLTGDAPTISFDFRRLRLEFAPGSFRPGVMYQYRLDPVDTEWSEWTTEPFIDYTNLSEGPYTFRLRARGPAAGVSREAVRTFSVLPPWYRSAWAIAIWALTALILLVLIIRLRTRGLRKQAEVLRVKIAERTDELHQTVERLRSAQDELVEANARLEQLSLVDDLTGIANRRYFQRAMVDEWNRALRRHQSLSLIFLDLDHFKQLNDQRGHPAGDECLREIGGFLAASVRRAGDVVARYGGEEFAILLPDVDGERAIAMAESLRIGIEKLAIPANDRGRAVVTASFGVASVVPDLSERIEELIERADRALYMAKNAGRNCVRIAQRETERAV
jgi:diguanylate cyclase (GGDEF)-like protein